MRALWPWGGLGEVELTLVIEAAELVASMLRKTPFPGGKPSPPAAVDTLDVLMATLLDEGVAKLSGLRAARTSHRAALKGLRLLAAQQRTESELNELQPPGSSANSSSFSFQSAVLDLASGPRLSESDHKISEELAAARKRLASVAGCEPSKAKLSELAEILQSDQPNEDKLQALRSVLVTDQKVADLIFSSHVREPTGARAVMPGVGGRELVEKWREVRSSLTSLLRGELREMLPPNADANGLAEMLLSGKLASSKKIELRSLANPRAPKMWLGTAAEEGSEAGSEQGANNLTLLFTVWPALVQGLEMLYAFDPSIGSTMAKVAAQIAKGLRKNGVLAALDHVLMPLFRELEEAWEAFQKSPLAPMPKLSKLWAAVKVSPSVAGYMAQAAVPSSSTPTQPPSEQGLAKMITKLMREEMAKTGPGAGKAKKPKGTKPKVNEDDLAGVTDDELGEKPDEAGPNWEKNRRLKLAQRKKATK